MALIGYESFDHEHDFGSSGGTDDIIVKPFSTGQGGGTAAGLWVSSTATSTSKVAAPIGGFEINFASVAASDGVILSSSYQRLILGFRFRTPTTLSGTTDFLKFYDSAIFSTSGISGTVQCGLSINSSGKIILWRGTNATVLGTSTNTFVANSRYFIEVDLTIDPTVGAFEVHINGAQDAGLTATGQNTRNSANSQMNAFQFCNTGTAGNIAFDDATLCDTTGSAPYNTFLGIVHVETSYPTAASGSPQFTPLSGTNLGNVDETGMDSDTTYNYSATSGNTDLFAHAALSSAPNTIFAVSVGVCARKEDVSNQQMKTQLVSGTTTQDGAAQNLATVYLYQRDIYINDPDTGSPWTAAGVNNSIIGYKHV